MFSGIYPEQKPFIIHNITGEAFFDKVTTIAACSTYIDLPLALVDEESIVSLAGMAAHVNPRKDGALRLTIETMSIF